MNLSDLLDQIGPPQVVCLIAVMITLISVGVEMSRLKRDRRR